MEGRIENDMRAWKLFLGWLEQVLREECSPEVYQRVTDRLNNLAIENGLEPPQPGENLGDYMDDLFAKGKAVLLARALAELLEPDSDSPSP